MPAPTPAQVTTALRLTPGLPQAKFGLLRPFSTDQARDLAQGTGDALLQSRVGQIAGSNGEFPWRPDLTSNLDRVRNIKEESALNEFARFYVSNALSTFEPSVTAVNVAAQPSGRTLALVVTCTRTSDLNLRPPKTFTARAILPL